MYKIYIHSTNHKHRHNFFKKNFLHIRNVPLNNPKSLFACLLMSFTLAKDAKDAMEEAER